MYCATCKTANDDAAKFCHKCGTKLSAPANPAPSEAVAPQAGVLRGNRASTGVKSYATGRNASVALVLSLMFVGVGQFYNGDVKKGAVMLVGGVVLLVLTFAAGGIGFFPIWGWSIYDAYQVANGKSALW